ncbi:MAG: NAD(P)H-dependent oxidoreductase [Candidatus Marinimicrobia bacterium]|nr:NAD(P)H-dependent oxidoreductase [Candidatus Neomarinimicrobiota bacterium]
MKKILILNGSPKGKQSVTLYYAKFVEKKFPNYEYEILNISRDIKRIENNEKLFNEIIDKVKKADLILWAIPVYVFLIPAQMKLFIELVIEKNLQDTFKNKYSALIMTSIHFYDNTATNYMRAICEDFGMQFIDYFSASMRSIFKKKWQNQLMLFAKNIFYTIENNLSVTKYYLPIHHNAIEYSPHKVKNRISTNGKKVLIITDSQDRESNLSKMTKQFQANFNENIEEMNIHNLKISGGCLGCIQCAYDNTCIYENSDEYNDFFENKVKKADILIFASTIKDRYFSARWKMFYDRSFYNNHAPQFIGKQIIYIVSGPLNQLPDIRQIFDAWTQIHRGNLVDFISDEYDNSAKLDKVISETAKKTIRFANQNFKREDNFLGVAGMNLFRDHIRWSLKFPFVADYKAYKKLGIFKSLRTKFKVKVFNSILYYLVKIPKFRDEIYKKQMKKQMVKRIKKLVDEI